MNIREDREQAIKKVMPLTERLSRQYGLTLNLRADNDHLRSVLEHYVAKRELMLNTQGEANAIKNPNYCKAVLISETVRLFLREIAPKRLSRRTKKEK
jgi:hypothetical protein